MLAMFATIVLMTLAFAQSALAEKVLTFGYIIGNDQPFVIRDEQRRISGGILKDLGDAIAQEVAMQARFYETSRKRIDGDLLKGEIHISCFLNPAWTLNAGKYGWSAEPVFTQRDIVVVHHQRPHDFTSRASLHGRKIGTLLGYIYEDYRDAFAKGLIKRIDASNLKANYRQLDLGKVDGIIVSEAEHEYLVKGSEEFRKKFIARPLVIGESKVFCATSPKAPIDISILDKVLVKLHKEQAIQKILDNYR